VVVAVAMVALFGATLARATITSTGAGGKWTTAATWGGNIVPGSGDRVVIAKGATVTVDSSAAACLSLLIGDGNGTSSTLTFATVGSPKLTVSGNVQVSQSTGNSRVGVITFKKGSTLVAGSLNLGVANNSVFGKIDMIDGGTLKVNGTIAVPGDNVTWIPGSGTVELTANNTLPSTRFTSFNNLTISSGTTVFSGNSTIAGLAIASDAKLGLPYAISSTATTLSLGGFGRENGTWGYTSSGATHINTAYFASTTGMLIVNTDTRSASTVTATGTTTFTYNGAPQGADTAIVTGSTGAKTYSYAGTGGTTYSPSSTTPTAAGTYPVTASVPADANYKSDNIAVVPEPTTCLAGALSLCVLGIGWYRQSRKSAA